MPVDTPGCVISPSAPFERTARALQKLGVSFPLQGLVKTISSPPDVCTAWGVQVGSSHECFLMQQPSPQQPTTAPVMTRFVETVMLLVAISDVVQVRALVLEVVVGEVVVVGVVVVATAVAVVADKVTVEVMVAVVMGRLVVVAVAVVVMLAVVMGRLVVAAVAVTVTVTTRTLHM